MKKILCLIDTLGFGGAERQMAGLALFLKKKGYQVDLVTYYAHDFYHDLVANGVRTITLRTRDNKFSKLLTISRFIKRERGYDWIIAYKDGPTTICCLLKMLGHKFRLIVSERNTSQCITIKDRLKFRLYHNANFIVPNSFSQADFISRTFPKLADKVVTITNFTDTDYFRYVDNSGIEKLIIMTAARITAVKNIMNYLRAISLLKINGYSNKVHFLWYGEVQAGEEAYAEKCYKMLQEMDIKDMVDFYPATTEIAHHYQSADIFCLPSLSEGYPNVICEAMSCGKPIACSNVCDNPLIVKEGVNALLFDPNDVDEIYSVLKKMIDMPKSMLAEWGNASRKIAEYSFSMESFVQKYIFLLDSE